VGRRATFLWRSPLTGLIEDETILVGYHVDYNPESGLWKFIEAEGMKKEGLILNKHRAFNVEDLVEIS
jgi:hypothetical protein